jgi:hypothetical protein
MNENLYKNSIDEILYSRQSDQIDDQFLEI